MPETAEAVIEQLVESCVADDRVAALFLGGSLARGEADEYSDIDLCVIVRDEAYADVIAGRDAFVRAVGEPLFLEDFGHDHMAFAILTGGTELELNFFRAHDLAAIRPGPHRVLLDKDGILTGVTFASPESDREAQLEQLRQILFWFWHDVGHFTAAIGRGQLWWAAGQLEQLRACCVTLVRIEQGGPAEDEAYWKLDLEIATEPRCVALDVRADGTRCSAPGRWRRSRILPCARAARRRRPRPHVPDRPRPARRRSSRAPDTRRGIAGAWERTAR
jgi:predicted nucleotidyltransferase